MAKTGLGSLMLAAVMAISGTGAQAQLFWKTPAFAGGPASGDDPTLLIALPGSTPAEQEANLVWTTRAALNVAALQCQFSPALMTTRNYNDLIGHHRAELAASYALLQSYFKRTAPKGATARAVAETFDRFNTRTYSSFSTVNAQMGFCQTSAHVGKQALLEPKGRFAALAHARLRELRSSLAPVGDMINVAPPPLQFAGVMPEADPVCRAAKRRARC